MRAVKRIRAIADLINEKNLIVADIGADHGYLSKILIEENRAKKVIATDISKPSIEKTAILAKKAGISDKIETRVGDGLNPLKIGEVNIVVIAGMGGYEIIKILEQNKDLCFDKLIFQPIQNSIQLRKYLNDNSYEILKDFIIKDKNKYYNTIVARFGSKKQELKLEEIEFGLTNFDLKSSDFYDYLLTYIAKCENIDKMSMGNYENKQKLQMAKNVFNKLYR